METVGDGVDKKQVHAKSLEAARQKRADFFDLVKDVKTSAEFKQILPKIQSMVTSAEFVMNSMLQSAGKIPTGDPRLQIFEENNAMLVEYERLRRLV